MGNVWGTCGVYMIRGPIIYGDLWGMYGEPMGNLCLCGAFGLPRHLYGCGLVALWGIYGCGLVALWGIYWIVVLDLRGSEEK